MMSLVVETLEILRVFTGLYQLFATIEIEAIKVSVEYKARKCNIIKPLSE